MGSSLFLLSETCRLFSSPLGVSFDVPLSNKHFLATLTQGCVPFLSASQCPVCMILMASLQCPGADRHFLLDCCLLEAGIVFYSPHIPSIWHILGIWQVFCKGLLTEWIALSATKATEMHFVWPSLCLEQINHVSCEYKSLLLNPPALPMALVFSECGSASSPYASGRLKQILILLRKVCLMQECAPHPKYVPHPRK